MGNDGKYRMTARVHVVRSKYTVAEIQSPDIVQQCHGPDTGAKRNGHGLLDIHVEDIAACDAFDAECAVACLTLDSHWDPESQSILGHAGICLPNVAQKLGIFGSHTTHAWPASATEIAAKFLDTTPTDTALLANDAFESDEYWKAANIGIGAFLHMALFALSIGRSDSGFPCRGYKHFSRAFMAKVPGHAGAVTQADEGRAYLHRPNALGLRHGCRLAMPGDAPFAESEVKASVEKTDDGVVVSSSAGVIAVEVSVNDSYRAHLEYTAENWGRRETGQLAATPDEAAEVFPNRIVISWDRLRELAGECADDSSVGVRVRSRGFGSSVYEALGTLAEL
ncbi:hypothetical protein H4R21_006548, partial [Coemansia helicoidea]